MAAISEEQPTVNDYDNPHFNLDEDRSGKSTPWNDNKSRTEARRESDFDRPEKTY